MKRVHGKMIAIERTKHTMDLKKKKQSNVKPHTQYHFRATGIVMYPRAAECVAFASMLMPSKKSFVN